jgi:PAS domain S-box-containing protein
MAPSAPAEAPLPAPDDAFDRVARLASRLAGAPMALLLLADAGVLVPAGAHGTHAATAPLSLSVEGSLGARVMESGAPFVVDDLGAAGLDALSDAAAWGMRAWAGVPVRSADGAVAGVLCVAGAEPRVWPADTAAGLADLAAVAEAELRGRAARSHGNRAAAALSGAEGLFRALVEQSLAAIYVIQDGVFRYMNPHAYQLLGHPPGWFDTPRSALDIIAEEDRPMVAENLRRRVDGELPYLHYRVRGLRYDGTTVYLEVHGSRAEIGGRPAVIGVAVDVTGRVRAERDREHAVRARDRFYAMVSHELRTPVSAVMLYNDLLASGVYDPLTDGQKEAVDRSQKSARHLLELINDLLDLAKLDAGKLETRLDEVEVGEVVESVVAGLAPLAREHGCEIVLRVDAPPLSATADARRVKQILLNLLSNAVKFGHGNPVNVHCAAGRDGVVVEVTDHGPGIEPADLERIFDEFVQIGEPDVGTGLGLPIARRLAELQGGSLHAASTAGQGSTFRLVLPTRVPPVSPSTGFSSPFSSAILR